MIERLAQLLMLRDVAPFPRVWDGPPQEGQEVDDRGVTWTTYTPACSDKERQKWRREALKFIEQAGASGMQITLKDNSNG
ncbi:MAG TPA: hypothetical protein PKY87_02240 [Terricaulis sp.]|nr:hypothetical protein [Terricaulis sp.]